MICITDVSFGESVHIYATGTTMEIDRCASAWLIKRYVDKDAEFQFFAEGEFIKSGISFDTPDSELCRTHNRSTFENIMAKYDISDDRVKKIAKIVHDIEINFWGKKDQQSSNKIERELNKIINDSSNNNACLKNCFDYFDQVHSTKK